jgi:flagellar hook-associated protein FlgK
LRRFWGRCFRFPWLPRWWCVYPEYWQEPTPKQEKEMLLEELKALREEIKAIEERLKELETKKEKK